MPTLAPEERQQARGRLVFGIRDLCGLRNNALGLCLAMNDLREGGDAQRGGRRQKRISRPIPRLDGRCPIK